jgi:hypothetical protein
MVLNHRLTVSVPEKDPVQEIEEIIVLLLVPSMVITLVDIEKGVEEAEDFVKEEGVEEEEEVFVIIEVLIINQDTIMVSEFILVR